MVSLSELLTNRRKELGLTISQVSENTKIPQKMLNALERGDYEVFSSEVYLKGFLRNYAKFLGIDVNKALAIYRRDREGRSEESFNDVKKPIEEQKPIVTPGRIVFVSTVVIVVLVVVFIAIQVNKIMQPPNLELKEPVAGGPNSELFAEVNSDSVTLAGKVEVGSKLLINGSEVTTNNLQEFRVEGFKLNPGSNEIYIVAESYYFSKKSEIKLTVLANYKNEDETDSSTEEEEEQEVSDEETESEEESEDLETMKIKIEVKTEEAWIVATVDGITKLENTVKSGEQYTYEAKESFTIYSPRPQLISLIINGEEYSFGSGSPAIFKIDNGSIVQE